MQRIRRPLPAGFALVLALSALASPTGASAAPADRGAPPPTFTVPASERVHGSAPTTTPASAAPNVATTPAGAAGSTAPRNPVATAPATTVPVTTAPASTAPVSTAPAPATGVPASTTPALPAGAAATGTPGTRHAATSTKLSTGAIVVAALAVLLIIICLAWGAARWFAYEPRWSISLRHSLAEASWRLSASWDEFSDWARIGR
jgi:hypothetical protein